MACHALPVDFDCELAEIAAGEVTHGSNSATRENSAAPVPAVVPT
jgi:hypothetical protein